MPPDPFADDPNDPARALRDLRSEADEGSSDDADAAEHEIDEQGRQELLEDIADLAVYQALLEPRGIRGVVVECSDCEEPHFHDWELLRASLQQLLEAGDVRPHEPAYQPDPDRYVTWEYCRGYADGVTSTESARP